MKSIYALLLTTLAACSAAPGDRNAVTSQEAPSPSPPILLEGTGFDAAGHVQLPAVPPAEAPGLHHVYRLSDTIISGAEPASPEALQTLAAWGVKTILSVDGKAPDAATAARLGMRYVHVPIQYSGIDLEQLLAIAKTFRELPGPFYVHCYHGKHRGPAAAAVGRVVLDGAPRDLAIAEMRQWCSTSSKYEGLYSTVATADMPTARQTRACSFDFSPAHTFAGMRAGMIEMTRRWDTVKAARKRSWAPDADHPDIAPVQEAMQLHQVFENLAALDETRRWPDDFRTWLEDGRTGSAELVRALTDRQRSGADSTAWHAEVETAFGQISDSCSSCHAEHRD
ncbi:MAG: hypothetical protein GY711_32025 [bacterium]|nr:hypothetical protein [bacterium]